MYVFEVVFCHFHVLVYNFQILCLVHVPQVVYAFFNFFPPLHTSLKFKSHNDTAFSNSIFTVIFHYLFRLLIFACGTLSTEYDHGYFYFFSNITTFRKVIQFVSYFSTGFQKKDCEYRIRGHRRALSENILFAVNILLYSGRWYLCPSQFRCYELYELHYCW